MTKVWSKERFQNHGKWHLQKRKYYTTKQLQRYKSTTVPGLQVVHENYSYLLNKQTHINHSNRPDLDRNLVLAIR